MAPVGECEGERRVFERKRKRRKEKRSEMVGQEGESEIFVRCVVGIKWGGSMCGPKKFDFLLFLFLFSFFFFVTKTLHSSPLIKILSSKFYVP